MLKSKTINVKLHSVNVFLPGKLSMFESKPKSVNFLEYHSYIKCYSLMWIVNNQYYQTERFYSDDMYENIVSYLSKHDEPLNISVEETLNKNTLRLIDVEFPDYFSLYQYTKVVEFTPLALRTKHCSLETYESLCSDKNLDDTPIFTAYDPTYQGDTNHSVTIIVDNRQNITKFSDLTHSEVQKLKSAIHNSTTLKGRFIFTQRTATLINVI